MYVNYRLRSVYRALVAEQRIRLQHPDANWEYTFIFLQTIIIEYTYICNNLHFP